MNIIFMCGSLEPGRDGVGDYVWRLAVELQKQGHQTAAIALNEKYQIQEFCGNQTVNGDNLLILRLPSLWPAVRRFARAKAWIKAINPEWLSLQFVPYAFNSKGLPWKLKRQLIPLGREYRWHIMFHELWIGMEQESSLKHWWWGKLQRELIRALIGKLKPLVIHTQTKIYQLQLENLGVTAKYLPLFSNIPVVSNTRSDSPSKSNLIKGPDVISFVLFGGIHPGAPVKIFTSEVASYAKKNRVQVVLKMVGRCGPEQEFWASIWQAAGLPVELIGEQSAEYISVLLSNANIGVSTTPIALAEKSGTVAAMREHGLPVLCVRLPWKAVGIGGLSLLPGVVEYQAGKLEHFLKSEMQNITDLTLEKIGITFVADLTLGIMDNRGKMDEHSN